VLLVMARRKGNDWYVAGFNGTRQDCSATVSLSFPSDLEYNASIILDRNDPNSFTLQEKKVSKTDTITVKMLSRDGFTVIRK
jgi:alpha-glucosidase